MLSCDWLTNDDDQDSSHYLESQGEGDESQDSNVVPEEESIKEKYTVNVIILIKVWIRNVAVRLWGQISSLKTKCNLYLYPAPCSMTVFMCVMLARNRAISNMPSAAVFFVAYRFMFRLVVEPP